jgi:hypothetical protein
MNFVIFLTIAELFSKSSDGSMSKICLKFAPELYRSVVVNTLSVSKLQGRFSGY